MEQSLRSKLKGQLSKLIEAKKWGMIRTWFDMYEIKDGVPTEQGLDERAHKCHLWGYMFMPEFLRSSGCDAHLDLIKENLSDKNEYTAFPRGFAKTTINQLTVAYECACGTQKFIPMIEKTWDEASNVLGAVRDTFTKPLTKKVYGKLIGRTVDGDEADRMPDSKGDMFINGVRLRAIGFDKTIRGLKSGAWRPTKIYVDDVEKDEHIGNPEQRKKYKNNYLKGIIPALDIEGSIKVRGTILHFASLLNTLIEDHDGKIYKAYDKLDPTNTLLWESVWTYDLLEQKRKDMLDEGSSSNAFFQEYLNEPISEDTRDFQWEWITKTYKEEDLELKNVNLFAALDVADAIGQGRDSTGCVVEAIDDQGNWYNKLTKNYKVDVLGLVNLIFELWQMPNMRKIGVEKKAFEDQIRPLLEQESEIRGIFPVVVELKHGGKHKVDRIRGNLQPLYRQGRILNKENPKDDTKLLWEQLYSIGGGIIAAKYDDLADAKSYIKDIAERPVTKEFNLRYDRSKVVGRTDPLK